MSADYIIWENNSSNWESESSLWNEAFGPSVEVEVSGGRNFKELEHQQDVVNNALKEQLLQNLERLKRESTNKLIEVLISINDKNYTNKKIVKDKKDIIVTLCEINLIDNNYLNKQVEHLK